MIRRYSFVLASLFAFAGAARAAPQVCTLGSAGAGTPGTLLCRDAVSGALTQSFALGDTVAGKGGTGGTLSHRGDTVLVTNQASGAVVFRRFGARLVRRYDLDTGGAGTLSGAVSDKGQYVVTADHILFFANGRSRASGSRALVVGDGSAAQVTVSGEFAYVSEKSGTLEAFPLGADGNLIGAGANVAGIPAGVIVGITGLEGLVVAPVAHLASNANQSIIPVASGLEQVQLVETKEVAACWAANDGHEACITNPGSMTVSCGSFGPGGFRSYTSAAAHLAGETLLDVDLDGGFAVAAGTHNGAAVLTTFVRSHDTGDFLTAIGEVAAGAPVTTGALVLAAY
ncbi:MAG TPA: hypothetical protein VLW85_20320 [Myxococcales bacterium]|nr:hypothetical protein [Myxococcales bacterium]